MRAKRAKVRRAKRAPDSADAFGDTLKTPNGWFQLIRGPRPPSVRWEKAPQQEQRGGRWRQPKDPVLPQQFPQRTALLEGGTASVRECTSVSPKTKVEDIRVEAFPRSGVVAARDRVSRLERALEAMGDSEGPEVDGLRVALEKAREFAKGVLLDKQIKDGEQFLIRAKGHLAELERAVYRRGQHRRRKAETRKVESSGRSSPTSGNNAASTNRSCVSCANKWPSWMGPARHRSVFACAKEFPGWQEVGSSQ